MDPDPAQVTCDLAARLDAEHERWYGTVAEEVREASPVHLCPDDGGNVMPCCGLTPFEVPRTDRMTETLSLVTCRTAAHDTMPDDRAPHHRPYVPESRARAPAYVPDLAADLRDLRRFRAAIGVRRGRLHPGCQCAPEGGYGVPRVAR